MTLLKRFAYFSVILTTSFFLFLISCEAPKEESQTEKFEKDLQSFNKRMDNIGQTIDILDAMQTELDQLESLRANGKISESEYNTRSNEVKDTYGRAMARKDNLQPANGLPQWAMNIGLTEPTGLILDAEYSQITTVENKEEGFNSVLLVYTGSYDLAMKEATRIARQAGIPLSKDFIQAKELSETYNTTPVKGIAYMNFDPFIKDAPINISITVDETGMLTISAVDVEQMRRQFDNGASPE
jgi:hypothetical protein